MIQKVLNKQYSFIFVCKEKSHKALYKTIESIIPHEKQTTFVKFQ